VRQRPKRQQKANDRLPLAKLIAGRLDEAKPAVLLLALVFAIKFALPG
jgi:hypothetical protein